MQIAVLGIDLGKKSCSVVTAGGKPRLLGITKRGSKYLRTMLIQGGAIPDADASEKQYPLGEWLRSLLSRAHPDTALVWPPRLPVSYGLCCVRANL